MAEKLNFSNLKNKRFVFIFLLVSGFMLILGILFNEMFIQAKEEGFTKDGGIIKEEGTAKEEKITKEGGFAKEEGFAAIPRSKRIKTSAPKPQVQNYPVSVTQNKKIQEAIKKLQKIEKGLHAVEEKTEIDKKAICETAASEDPLYQGEFMQKQVDMEVMKNSAFKVMLYMKNTGNMPWFSDNTLCHPKLRLGTTKDQDRKSVFYYKAIDSADTGWIQPNRIKMKEDRVNPDELATFEFIGFSPDETDTYVEYFQPVIEGKEWLTAKEETVRLNISVGYTDFDDSERVKYLNKSAIASIIDLDASLKAHIDLSDQKMNVYKGDVLIREYNISTGASKTPTPRGEFKVLNKQDLRVAAKSPHYRMPKWQGFTKWGHGLHGLPFLANDNGIFWKEALNHIGRPVSHGCVRLLPNDAEDLYTLTNIGDTIHIHS